MKYKVVVQYEIIADYYVEAESEAEAEKIVRENVGTGALARTDIYRDMPEQIYDWDIPYKMNANILSLTTEINEGN